MRYFYLLFFIFLGFNCSNDREKAPDVSNISVQLNLHHFADELFQLDTLHLETGLDQINKQYPEWASLYFNRIMGIEMDVDSLNSVYIETVKQMLQDTFLRDVYQKSKTVFPDYKILEEDLIQTCKYLKYYFPKREQPDFVTLISGYAVGNFIYQEKNKKDVLGIGLDFFLGNEVNYKLVDPKNPAFSDYLNRTFNKDHLLKKTWQVYVEDMLGPETGNQFLDYIIYNGKKLFILSKLIPQIQDSVLFEYPQQRLNWCNENKVGIWTYFLSERLLYSTESLKFNKYINPSPNSPGMPSEAPGQTGAYIGYYIIKEFMKRHPQLSLEELIQMSDSQKILEDSKFKPKNN